MEVIGFLGRFHPVVLHLPIGMLILAAILEVGNKGKGQKSMDLAITKTLFWSTTTALISVIFGLCLQNEGGFENDILFWHRITGILTFILSLILYILKYSGLTSTIYGVFWIIMLINLLLTGHLGATLTHGSGYLLEYLPQGIRHSLGLPDITKDITKEQSVITSMAMMEEASVFDDLINPIIQNKCGSCHNETKAKGELSFHSIAALQKGGETGSVFEAGSVKNSLMMERIHLALDHDDHMPPKGKRQLTKEEIVLMEWWITEHKSFESKVKDYSKTAEVESILTKKTKKINPVYNLDLPMPKDDKIAKVNNKGIIITRNARNNPFVEGKFKTNQEIEGDDLKALKPFAKQLISLDLGGSKITDDLLKDLSQFPHLIKVQLNNTEISDAGLVHLQTLPYLESLNLYNTKVTDKGINALQGLKHMTKLYVWDTEVTDEGLRNLQRMLPELIVFTGMNLSEQFDSIQLKAPAIQADEEIFKDSLKITLRLNIKDVNIYYSLDGSEPDSIKFKYQGPFYIHKTASVRCKAVKSGWVSSEVSAKTFVRQKYKAKAVTLAQQPNPRYKAEGANSLIDLKKGSVEFTDNKWLGFQKQPVIAVIDLGDTVEVASVTIGSIINIGSYLFPPRGMTVEVSMDGKKFKLAGSKTSPALAKAEINQIIDYNVIFKPQNSRYLRVKIASQMTNPKWHNAPGQPSWLFIDEILVE